MVFYMLNELINVYNNCCPVCGRYHNGPMDYWWCDYCGPTLDTITINKVNDILARLIAIETKVNDELPIQSISAVDIDVLGNLL